MISPRSFCDELFHNGVGFVSGVPDSLLKHFCSHVEATLPSRLHVINANEGAAVAAAVGFYLGTGKLGLVYLQNSGLGNAVNPLVSLADREVHSIFLVLLIGWRGEPGVKDEPQHIKQGRITPALLGTLEIPYRVIDGDQEGSVAAARWSCERALAEQRPVAILVREGAFVPPEADQSRKGHGDTASRLEREEAISEILQMLGSESLVVATTGKISRELYELRKARSEPLVKDFLAVGSMGHVSQIALGLALGQPGREVYCLDGDGSAIMHMGSLAICGQSGARNLKHIILNNGCHESVGGQPTVGFGIDFCTIAAACGYAVVGRASNHESLRDGLARLRSVSGPAFLEVRVKPGSRPDLGRPKETPLENKTIFMEFMKGLMAWTRMYAEIPADRQ